MGLLFTRFWLFSVLYATWWYLDREKPRQGGRSFQAIRRCFLWKYMRDYFPVSVSTGTGWSMAMSVVEAWSCVQGVEYWAGRLGLFGHATVWPREESSFSLAMVSHLRGCGANVRNDECTGLEGALWGI